MIRQYSFAAAIIATILLILGIISLATPGWVYGKDGSTVGLWEYCLRLRCGSFDGTQADYIKAVQAFHIIGLMSLVMAAVIAGLAAAKEDKQRLRFAAVLLSLAGLFYTVSMSVFTHYYYAFVSYSYGYSYILGWVVVAVAYIAGIGFEYVGRSIDS